MLVASAHIAYTTLVRSRLTMVKTPGPTTVSPGDQGGPLTNGGLHTGEILQGDVDVWTFTAAVGERITINIAQVTETDDFRPWIRLWAPNGASLGDIAGVIANTINNDDSLVAWTYLA